MRCAFTEDDFIADSIFFSFVNRLQDGRCLIILLQNSLTDDLGYIGRGKGYACIKTALNL